MKLFRLDQRIRPVVLVAVCAFLALLNSNLAVLGDGPDDQPAEYDASQIQKFSSDELGDLVAPIALYPDSLLSLALQASAFPQDLSAAYSYAQSSKTPTVAPDSATWDPSVIALLNYPTVLKKLNDDSDWTEKLGVAVTYQMTDVSDAVQQVRAEAQAAGNLPTTEQQTVAQDGDAIMILPTQPNTIYVPTYDPEVIFVRHDNWRPFITFGTGFGVGVWLENRWDWHRHSFYRSQSWRPGGGWYRPSRPVYWRPPVRPIPTWYRRGYTSPRVPIANQYRSGRATPERVRPAAPARIRPVRPETRPVRPEVRPVAPVQPAQPVRPARPSHVEGFGSANNTVRREAARGEVSRRPAAPAAPARPAVRPAPAPQVRPQQNFQRPADGRATQHESARGAASRHR